MNGMDYTIWFSDEDPAGDYMWSLDTEEGRGRTWITGAPEMFAPLIKDGVNRSFQLLKARHSGPSEAKQESDPVTVFGTGKKIDLLKNLLGRPVFGNRTIEETFTLLGRASEPGHYYIHDHNEWEACVSAVVNYLNTSVGDLRIVFSHDRGFYWKGTVTAAVQSMEDYLAVVKVKADVEAFKYERYASDERWIWADFSFIDGIIRDGYGQADLEPKDDATTVTIPVRTGDIVPEFRRKGTNNLRFAALNMEIIAMAAYVQNAIETEAIGSDTAAHLSGAWESLWTNDDSYYQLTVADALYEIPEADVYAERIGAAIDEFSSDAGNEHEALYDLEVIRNKLTELVSYVYAAQVIASTDGGQTWHSVGYAELEANDDIVLKGAWDGSRKTAERELLLKGVMPVTIHVRGTAL